MYFVDPDFKMSYDLRNDQEANARSRMIRVDTQRTKDDDEASDHSKDCQLFGSSGMRWACMTGLALLGIGVGYSLGRDQYNHRKSNSLS